MKVGDIFTKQNFLVEIVLPLLLDLQLTVKSIILILLIHIIIILYFFTEGPQQLENKKMHDVRLHDVIEHSMRIVCICAIKAD